MIDEKLKPGWTIVEFGDVVKLNKDTTKDPLNDGIERFVGLTHIEPDNLRIKEWGLVSNGTSFTQKFRTGHVLFGKRRAYQRKIAVADFEGICSSDIYVFEPKDNNLTPDLLPFICKTEAFYDFAIGTSAGSLSPRTKWKHLKNFKFALPPIEEQRRIAEILMTAENLLEIKRQLLYCLNQISKSIRLKYFDYRLGDTVALEELCKKDGGIQTGPFGVQLPKSDYQKRGIPVILPTNMKNETIDTNGIARISQKKADFLSKYKIRSDDILLPLHGELDRRVWVNNTEEGWICGSGSIRIRMNSELSSRVIFHALSCPATVNWLIGHAECTTMLTLNTEIVSKIPIRLPDLNTQKSILQTFKQHESTLSSALDEYEKLHIMKTNLLSSLLSGNW